MSKKLSRDEVVNLIYLPEGDVSDFDEDSDDETEDGWISELENESEESHEAPLSVEVEDEPSTATNKLRQRYRWVKKPLPAKETTWKGKFSDPPEDTYSPYHYYKLFFDDDMISSIANQTNIYSMQHFGKELGTTPNQIEQFIGIHVLMGIFNVPQYRMFWESSTRFPPIADIMTRSTFDRLRSSVHFNDNTEMKPRGHPEYDRLFKVRPLLNALRENMMKVEPEERHSVDEQMVPFKGRSQIKQYMPKKPHKWGFKILTRCGVSGIIYDFEVYVGQGSVPDTGLGVSGDVVIRLVRGLDSTSNHKLYFDNWFTSMDLMVRLQEMGIWAIGTVRRNRLKGCVMMTDKEISGQGRGSIDYRCERDDRFIAVEWADNKVVHLLSSYCGVEPLSDCRRYNRATKQHDIIKRPAIVAEYVKYMGGVDLSDMLIELYRINIRSKRWYLRLFYYCIDTAVNNAWLLYRRHCGQLNKSHMKLLVFRAQIAEALMLAGKAKKRGPGRPLSPLMPIKKSNAAVRPVGDVRYDQYGHWPQFTSKQQRCKLCPKGYTHIICSKCNVGLCLVNCRNCFYEFHNRP